jgi:hypothetical protein
LDISRRKNHHAAVEFRSEEARYLIEDLAKSFNVLLKLPKPKYMRSELTYFKKVPGPKDVDLVQKYNQ